MEDILFEAIPKVFKDAIYVANSCNIRYIWVNSCKYGMAVWFTTLIASRGWALYKIQFQTDVMSPLSWNPFTIVSSTFQYLSSS
jgi:hypothetical protein